MKRILFIILTFIIFCCPIVKANVIPHSVFVVAEEELNSENIKKNELINLIAIDTYKITDNIIVNKGDRVEIKILKYVQPTRGKRDGYYKIQVISANEKSLEKRLLTGNMKVASPKDFKSIAESAGVTVVGHILKVPGFTQAVALSKGLIKPGEEGRLKSAGKNLYESTPLTYIEKGEDFKVDKDGIVVLKLKCSNDDNE